jgi:hypothetical protein
MGLKEILGLIPAKISRRGVLLGLSAVIAAPFVIRTPGLLMPVRNRIMASEEIEDQELIDRIIAHQAIANRVIVDRLPGGWPPSVKEVKRWRRKMQKTFRPGMCDSYTEEQWARLGVMIDAEMRFKAMGLL